jgi:hypothetical protein
MTDPTPASRTPATLTATAQPTATVTGPEAAIARAEEARAAYVSQVRKDIAELDGQLAPLQAARDRLQGMLTGGSALAPAPPRRRQARRQRAAGDTPTK